MGRLILAVASQRHLGRTRDWRSRLHQEFRRVDESEDLAITPAAVTVRYVFLNQSASPVTLTVAFPLPDIDLTDAETLAFPTNDPANFVGFSTKVDGKPVNFTVNQRAFVNNKEVTATFATWASRSCRSAPSSRRSPNCPSRRPTVRLPRACSRRRAPTTRASLSMKSAGR